MTSEYSEAGMEPWPVQAANANRRANAAIMERDAARDAERAATEAWKRLLGDEAKARAELDAALARVKELESERDANANAYFARLAHIEAANADRARLRSALEQVRSAMEASDQGPDGDNDPRRPLASAVWAAIATTDASQWLRERERRVAERVREETLRLAFFRLKSTLGAGQAQATLGRVIDELRVTPIDAALLKEET